MAQDFSRELSIRGGQAGVTAEYGIATLATGTVAINTKLRQIMHFNFSVINGVGTSTCTLQGTVGTATGSLPGTAGHIVAESNLAAGAVYYLLRGY